MNRLRSVLVHKQLANNPQVVEDAAAFLNMSGQLPELVLRQLQRLRPPLLVEGVAWSLPHTSSSASPILSWSNAMNSCALSMESNGRSRSSVMPLPIMGENRLSHQQPFEYLRGRFPGVFRRTCPMPPQPAAGARPRRGSVARRPPPSLRRAGDQAILTRPDTKPFGADRG